MKVDAPRRHERRFASAGYIDSASAAMARRGVVRVDGRASVLMIRERRRRRSDPSRFSAPAG